jgi:hypothetical protein
MFRNSFTLEFSFLTGIPVPLSEVNKSIGTQEYGELIFNENFIFGSCHPAVVSF